MPSSARRPERLSPQDRCGLTRRDGRSRELNRIILLTPNEGLSKQHLDEFGKSGIYAELFNKDGRGLFTGKAVEILEVTKLRDDATTLGEGFSASVTVRTASNGVDAYTRAGNVVTRLDVADARSSR